MHASSFVYRHFGVGAPPAFPEAGGLDLSPGDWEEQEEGRVEARRMTPLASSRSLGNLPRATPCSLEGGCRPWGRIGDGLQNPRLRSGEQDPKCGPVSRGEMEAQLGAGGSRGPSLGTRSLWVPELQGVGWRCLGSQWGQGQGPGRRQKPGESRSLGWEASSEVGWAFTGRHIPGARAKVIHGVAMDAERQGQR